MNSDEAITALSAKHIAEGGRPALYYYGAFFQGSLPQHFSALLFGWKKYGALVFFSAVGVFPLIMNGIYRKFVLAKFLLPVGPVEMDPLPIGSYKDLVLSLLVSGPIRSG